MAKVPEFMPKPLTQADRAHFRSLALGVFQSLVHSIQFVSKGNVVVIDKPETKSTITQARVSMPGQLDDVAEYYLGTIDKPELYCNQMRYEHTKAIYNLVPRTPNHPNRYMGLRWNAYATPVLCRPRDLFVLEYFDEFTDERGRRGWARCFQSVEHSSCPSVPGYVRATARTSGFVAIESTVVGVIDFYVILDVNFSGHLSSWIRKMIIAKQMRTIHLLEEHLGSIVQDSPALRYFREVRKLSEPIHPKPVFTKTRLSAAMSDPSGLEERSFDSVGGHSSSSLRYGRDMDWNVAMPAECAICRSLLRVGQQFSCSNCTKSVCTACSRPSKYNRRPVKLDGRRSSGASLLCLDCIGMEDDEDVFMSERPSKRLTPQHSMTPQNVVTPQRGSAQYSPSTQRSMTPQHALTPIHFRRPSVLPSPSQKSSTSQASSYATTQSAKRRQSDLVDL
ncbi:hypothetical protein THRCLA_10221, partial [Thraustotheca clavata]